MNHHIITVRTVVTNAGVGHLSPDMSPRTFHPVPRRCHPGRPSFRFLRYLDVSPSLFTC